MPDSHLTIPAVIEHTRDDLRRVDGTAAIHILGIVGLAALIGEIGGDLPPLLLIGVACAAPPAAATITAAAAVLWARHINVRGIIAPGSWLHATREPSWHTLLAAYRNADADEYTARQLWTLARIAENKYQWLRRSSILLWSTIAILVVGAAGGLSATIIWGR